MIYLVDQPVTSNSHSKYLIDIIQDHTDVEIEVVEMKSPLLMNELYTLFTDLATRTRPIDIVLCAWCVPGDHMLDHIVSSMVEQGVTIVAAAGNFHQPLEMISPARSDGVLVVGTLNKQGMKAALSNYSEHKQLIWVPGTNYSVGWKTGSGTSVSAALYAAWLAEARLQRDPSLLDKLMREHGDKVFAELNQA